MGERFGKRWLDEYGDKPTKAWTDLLDRYTQDDLSTALGKLKDRPEQSRAHPPTHAEFESMLAKVGAARKTDLTDYVRGYWRSAIVHEVGRNLGYNFDELEPVMVANRQTLGASMRHLLDKYDGLEKTTGQRTEGMHDACVAECLAMTESYPELETIYSFQALVRKMRAMQVAQ
jgi:hypothetical protein